MDQSSVIVKLGPSTIYHQIGLGAMRWYLATKESKEDSVAFLKQKDGILAHMMGALGEEAASSFLGLRNPMSVGTFKTSSDLPFGIEVRTVMNYSDKKDGDRASLIVRERDSEGRIYLLVGEDLPTFYILGWVRGSEAKVEKYKENPNGRGEAYFVPQRELKNPRLLLSMVGAAIQKTNMERATK